jgi:hypothetical protein
MDIEDSTACWEHGRQVMAFAATRHIVLLDAAIHAHDHLHDEGLPNTSAGGCHRRATWWSVTSMVGNASSAGSANFAN